MRIFTASGDIHSVFGGVCSGATLFAVNVFVLLVAGVLVVVEAASNLHIVGAQHEVVVAPDGELPALNTTSVTYG